MGVGDFLTGRFLVGGKSIVIWKFGVIFLLFGLFLVYQAHQTESHVHEVAVLKNEIKALRAQYIETSTELMQMKLESSVRLRVEEFGLRPSVNPPYKIEID